MRIIIYFINNKAQEINYFLETIDYYDYINLIKIFIINVKK